MANDHHNGWGESIQVRQGIAFISWQTPDFLVMGEMVEDKNSGGGALL